MRLLQTEGGTKEQLLAAQQRVNRQRLEGARDLVVGNEEVSQKSGSSNANQTLACAGRYAERTDEEEAAAEQSIFGLPQDGDYDRVPYLDAPGLIRDFASRLNRRRGRASFYE